jgi:hypothetical protein
VLRFNCRAAIIFSLQFPWFLQNDNCCAPLGLVLVLYLCCPLLLTLVLLPRCLNRHPVGDDDDQAAPEGAHGRPALPERRYVLWANVFVCTTHYWCGCGLVWSCTISVPQMDDPRALICATPMLKVSFYAFC